MLSVSLGWPSLPGAILATLHEAQADQIVLNDRTRVFLGKARCGYPVGTRLQIVYAESAGKKVALSLERDQLS